MIINSGYFVINYLILQEIPLEWLRWTRNWQIKNPKRLMNWCGLTVFWQPFSYVSDSSLGFSRFSSKDNGDEKEIISQVLFV